MFKNTISVDHLDSFLPKTFMQGSSGHFSKSYMIIMRPKLSPTTKIMHSCNKDYPQWFKHGYGGPNMQ
jgi:hypothetical protein